MVGQAFKSVIGVVILASECFFFELERIFHPKVSAKVLRHFGVAREFKPFHHISIRINPINVDIDAIFEVVRRKDIADQVNMVDRDSL